MEGRKLFLTKAHIGIYTDRENQFISSLIISAEEEIADLGIVLKKTYSDDNLVAMYAAWMYRSRKSGEDKPKSLKYSLNTRLLKEKAGSTYV